MAAGPATTRCRGRQGAAPGRPSIDAVLRPAEVDYLYFVSRNDGSHVFSRTYAEHRAKVREFQVDFFRNK